MGFGDLPVSVDKQCARRSGDTARWEAEIGFVVVEKTPVCQTLLVKAAPRKNRQTGDEHVPVRGLTGY